MLGHLILFCLSLCTAQDYVPFKYVTPTAIYGGAFTKTLFFAGLCKQYDGLDATISINMPYAAWSVSNQQIVNVLVYNNSDLSGSPIQSNNGGGTTDPTQEFNFIYQNSDGDLYIQVTTGNAGNIVYTMTLAFSNSTQMKPIFISAKPVVHTVSAPLQLKSAADFVTLNQIIVDDTVYKVLTGSHTLINFAFCPSQTSYNIVVQVSANDERTATSLYVCLPSEQPCDASKAAQSRSDPRPIAINTVSLPTTSTQYSNLQAAVYGWGDYQQVNEFLFSVNVVT